jgi:hypothetical protein
LIFFHLPPLTFLATHKLNLVMFSCQTWNACSACTDRKPNPLCIWVVELSCLLFSAKYPTCVWHWMC